MASVIRGLTVETVERNLVQRGWGFEDYRGGPWRAGAEKPSRLGTFLLSADKAPGDSVLFTLTYAATSAKEVKWLRAGATLPTGKVVGEVVRGSDFARPMLAFIATFPYDGAEPLRARAWVEANVDNDGAEIVLGSAKFSIELRADERVSTLKMDPV